MMDDTKKTLKLFVHVIIGVVVVEVLLLIALLILVINGVIDSSESRVFMSDSLLSTGLTIIGIAVSAWAGLNIANAIDRKNLEEMRKDYNDAINKLEQKNQTDIDIIKNNNQDEINNFKKATQKDIDDLRTKSDTIILDLNKVYKDAKATDKQRKIAEFYELIAELMSTDDSIEATILKNALSEYQPEESVSMTELVQMERLYTIVHLAHRSEYVHDTMLINNAETGIEIANRQLQNTNSEALQKYLNLRIAGFYFYQGYCELHEKRQECFDKAIDTFTAMKEVFQVVPPPKEKRNLDSLQREQREISAYFYSAIGESNSKVIHLRENNDEDNKFKERLGQQFTYYGFQAKVNCDYAQQFVKNEEHLRNYGCAIERADGITDDNLNELKRIYLAALDDKATESTFKVILSLYDKWINSRLNIKSVYGGQRDPALNDSSYHNNYSKLSYEEKSELESLLKDMERISSQAEKFYPTSSVGYTYKCIYFRDKCVIEEPGSSEIIKYLKSAQDNLNYLIMVKPNTIKGGYDGLTNLIIRDLQALDSGKDSDDRIIRDY